MLQFLSWMLTVTKSVTVRGAGHCLGVFCQSSLFVHGNLEVLFLVYSNFSNSVYYETTISIPSPLALATIARGAWAETVAYFACPYGAKAECSGRYSLHGSR